MKKEIKEVVLINGEKVLRVTTTDERWYTISKLNKSTGLPEYQFIPSVTWIAGCYPKGIQFYKWLANQGWDESQSIKEAAGDKGSKVHYAIKDLIDGKEIKIDDKYLNQSKNELEELTVEEYDCIMSFANWFNEVKPEVIASEVTIFNKEHNYAGTVDLICKIGQDLYIIDFKTSANIWPEYELQLSAYGHADLESKVKGKFKLAILQVGYKRNRAGWKFTELEDKFSLFLNAKEIWKNEHETEKPKQKDYPLNLKLISNQSLPRQM